MASDWFQNVLTKSKGEIMVGWSLDPTDLLPELGIFDRLQDHADWQVLKEYSFGTLAFDHEEGLKFRTDIKRLPEVLEFIRKFHNERRIPFNYTAEYDFYKGRIPFCSCSFVSDIQSQNVEHAEELEAMGLVRSEVFCVSWEIPNG
jgi:hypothetical protein